MSFLYLALRRMIELILLRPREAEVADLPEVIRELIAVVKTEWDTRDAEYSAEALLIGLGTAFGYL